MVKFIRIFLLAFFILTISTAPLLAKKGGHGKGGWHGQSRRGAVPEIDPSLAPSAIALLTGGLLILKSKSGKKINKD